MALAPAPHTPPVFRVLHQAWRDYMASGAAAILTIGNPANQLATATTPVSGTVTADPSVPSPVQVTVTLSQSGTPKASQTAIANAAGAWSTTFPASTLVAGSASASAICLGASTVTSNNFTVS